MNKKDLCEKSNFSSNHNSNSALWNAMMYPLTKTAVTGALWFQGRNYFSKK
jgi:hypothetical protein